VILLGALLVAACGGTGQPADDAGRPDAGPAPDAGSGPDGGAEPARIGLLELVELDGWSRALAQLRDAPEVPPASLLAREGDCEILVHPSPGFCEPACTTGFCLPGGTCVPWPADVSAGPITVTGLTTPLAFVAGPYGYVSDPPDPPVDLFAPGALIVATAAGAAGPAFTVEARGVAPLVTTVSPLTLADGVDTEVTWQPAAGEARVQLVLLVGWHGAPYEAMLRCEADDDGALTIPGTLIAALPRQSSGLEQHPSTLARFTRGVGTTPLGTIELLVASQVFVYFSHP
jgi:hypothetical protein